MPETQIRHPLVELTLARIKEFIREPEAIFWVFAFPILLTMALGLAFREKAPDKILVGVAEGPMAKQRAAALAKSPVLQPRVYPIAQGREELRLGKISLLIALICFLGGWAFAGIGLLVASRARTLEAVSGLINFVMVPMWICSGVFFSYERFPDAAKPFIRALPLTALNDALRGVMNDGF